MLTKALKHFITSFFQTQFQKIILNVQLTSNFRSKIQFFCPFPTPCFCLGTHLHRVIHVRKQPFYGVVSEARFHFHRFIVVVVVLENPHHVWKEGSVGLFWSIPLDEDAGIGHFEISQVLWLTGN